MVESRLEKRRDLGRRQRRPGSVTRDNGKTWKNVTPKDLVGARIQTIEDSPHCKGRAYIAGYRFMREHDLKPYIYRTDNYGETLDAADRRQERHPDRSPDARRPRGSARRPACSTPAREFGVLRVVQRRQELAAAAAEPAGDAGHRHQGAPQRPRHLDDGTVGCGSWTTSRRCSSWRRSSTGRARPRAAAMTAVQRARSRQPADASSAAGGGAVPAARHDPLSQQHRAAVEGRAGIPGQWRAVRSLLRDRAGRRHQARSARRRAARRCAPGTSRRRRAPARRRRRCAGRSRRGGGGSTSIRAEAGMQRITWDLRYPGPWTAQNSGRRPRRADGAARASTASASPRAARPSRARSS